MRQKYTLSTVAIVISLITVFAGKNALAAPGDIDYTFNASDARVLTKVGNSGSEARDVLIQTDGKIVVVGKGVIANAFGDFAVLRYNSDGSLDTSFDGDGKAVVTVGIQDSIARAAVLQPDGKIIVVGEARSSNAAGSDFAVVRFNSNGLLDESFGTGGKVITSFLDNSGDSAASVVVQADNKIVVGGGSNGRFAVARYNSNGTLDESFGTNGKVTTALGNRGDAGLAMVIQPDGKIILAGNASTETAPGNVVYQVGLARYNTNGSLDTSFDSDGKVLTSIGDYNVCSDIALQSGGRIVVAGSATISPNSNSLDFALAGFNPDGSLDPGFGNGGRVLTPIGNGEDRAYSLAVKSDDKLIIAGEAQQVFGVPPFSEANGDVAVAQYNSNGTLDTTFGSGGKVITPVATSDLAYAVAVQIDGKIVVAGKAAPLATVSSIAVIRYQSSGALDQNFGYKIPGSVSTVVRGTIDEARAVTVQQDGKIVSVGRARVTNRYYFAVARQNADGTLDTGFGSNGTIITKIGAGDTDSEARAVALQSDGKIIVAGRIYDASTNLGQYYFALARYNPDGTLDPTFDGDGTLIVPATYESNEAFAVGVQSDGKIVVAGFYDTIAGGEANYDLAVVRLESNGSLDASFDGDGIATTDLGSSSETAFALAIQSDSKIVIAGSGGVASDFALVRYNINGSLDAGFGANGKVLTPVGTSLDEIRSIALQADGKIVAAGNVRVGSQSDFAVVRYNYNGTLDSTFDDDGKVITPIVSNSNDLASSVLVQANGKIIVVGSSTTGTGSSFNSDIVIVRYKPNGMLDGGFGNNGIVIIDYARYEYSGESANSAILQPNGKLIVAGSIRDSTAIGYSGDRRSFLLARFTVNNKTSFDYDGDGKSDVSVFRPSNGVWYLLNSKNGFAAAQFGISTDRIVPADYDGDGRTDIAVWREGVWYLQRSSLGFASVQFGSPGDVPQPADFDGDGRAELVVFRPSTGYWFTLNLVNNAFTSAQFGISPDKPVAADYDGDGKADYAVYRPSNGVWYIQRSRDGFIAVQFGSTTDKPVAADYDGDGKADVAVFRPDNGTWYINRSGQGFASIQFGIATDLPAPADYDGDGKIDIAVFRAAGGNWYMQQSTLGFASVQFGSSNDKPTPNAFVP